MDYMDYIETLNNIFKAQIGTFLPGYDCCVLYGIFFMFMTQ